MNSIDKLHPPLRLLERPAHAAWRAAARRQAVVERPVPSIGAWAVCQVERYFAWGESFRHHRMGSYTAH